MTNLGCPDNRGPDNRGPDNRGPDNRGPDNRGPDKGGSTVLTSVIFITNILYMLSL